MSSPPLKQLEFIQKTLIKKQASLSVAESCTGGLISYWLSHLPGASAYFKGSLVSYSTEIKKNLLGLDSKWVEEKGVINEETAKVMAQGVRNLLKTDWSLSVTGIAGPASGDLGEPPGQMAFSVSSPFAIKTQLEQIVGKNRQEVRHQAALFALDFLISELK